MSGFEPNRRRRLILNNDGDTLQLPHLRPETAVEQLLSEVIDPLVNTHVDSLFWCVGHNTVRYDTQAGEFFAEDVEKFSNAYEWRSREITKTLIQQGRDPAELLVREGHTNGLEVFLSFRMNDGHDFCQGPGEILHLCRIKREHPECILDVLERPQGRSYFPWCGLDMALDYSNQFVIESRHRVLEEMLTNFAADGLEMDFMRHPRYFQQGTERKNAHFITELLRQVRRIADRIEKQQQRHVGLAVRVPPSVKLAEKIGLDVTTWMQEELVDIVTVSNMDSSIDMDVESYLEARRGDCKVYACISAMPWWKSGTVLSSSAVGFNSFPSDEEFRGIAYNYWKRGVDGIYLWNVNLIDRDCDPQQNGRILNELGEPKLLKNKNKSYHVYNMEYCPRSYADYAPILPIEISEDIHRPTIVKIRIADNPACDDSTQIKGALKIRIDNCTWLDELSMKLNGNQLLFENALVTKHGWIIFESITEFLRYGQNEVSIATINRNQDIAKALKLVDVEVDISIEQN